MNGLTEKERLALEEVFLCISPRRGRYRNFSIFKSINNSSSKNISILTTFTTKPKLWLKNALKQSKNTKSIRFYHK